MVAVSFSIGAMTSLGFGDMCDSILLTVQSLIGYVLLGALITRLGIMFTADGPIERKGTMSDKVRKETAEREETWQKREQEYQEQRKKD